MTDKNPPSAADVVIRISYQSSLGAQRGAVFETYVPLSASMKTITAIMDKLRIVCDVQNARTAIVDLKRQLIADKTALEALVSDRDRIAKNQVEMWDSTGRKGAFKLSASEAQHRQNLDGSILNRQKSIELLEAQLAEQRRIVEEHS